MVEVILREYCEEIDSLIDQGAFDAAISHCQHILKIHPKYLKVYSLLGKAALEKGDLEAAADLFSRVLSMDPEDFVARVGMSIASDKDGSLDQAIWHMERAFELAPDNQAIVGELGRLYGRRDGVEPQKVQLTQGALARLHARGNLYTQAINEQRRLLQTEPERVDLQVALAETLWRADRRIEAAEASLTILEKLPYCLKANLILGEIWSSSGREVEGAAHLERAQMIDPENEVSQDLFGGRSPLPRTEVYVGRMEYVSPPAPAEQEPDWLQTLIDEDGGTTATDEAVPDWLQAVAASAVVKAMSPEEEPAAESEQVPDWLQDVAATADVDAEEFVSAPETPAPSESDMPDWLAQLTTETQAASDELHTPEDIPDGSAEEAVPGPGDVPDWLSEIGPAAAGLVAAEMAAAGLTSAEDEPELTDTELLGAEESELAPAEIPDWLAEMAPSGVDASTDVRLDEIELDEEDELEPGEIPDWLAEMAPTDTDVPTEDSLRAEADDVPDWLAEIEPTAGGIAAAGLAAAGLAAATEDEPEPIGAEDSDLAPGEIPDWLAEMAPTEALPIEAEAERGELPDWLADLDALGEEARVVEDRETPDLLAETALVDGDALADLEFAEVEPTEAAGFGEELVAEEIESAPPQLVAAATPDWLEELVIAAGVTVEEEEPLADQAVELKEEALPEWLAEPEKTPDALDLGEETAAIQAEDLDISEGEPLAYAQEEAEATLDAETELMAHMEEMSPDEAFAAWETMLAEAEEEQVEESAPAPEEAEIALDAEAELITLMEELPPEEAFAAWEAVLAESEPDEAASEPETLQPESYGQSGTVVIEEPDKEALVYPEGAGGEVTDAEAELMAQMEEMSPEEAFAAWEAMLADSEEPEPEAAAPVLEDVVVPSEEVGEAVPDAETDLMARLEEMSPEEAFAAWETMLAEDETLEPEEAAPTPEDVAPPPFEEQEETQDADTELLAGLEEMSPEDAFAAWETMLADSDDALLEAETPSVEVAAEEERAWMVQAEATAVEAEQELPGSTAADLDQAWMTLAEDESPEEIPALPTSEEESIMAGIEAEERTEDELPLWATAEAVETIDQVPPPAEQEIRMGPDVVLLTEEEEAEIAAPIDIGEPVPDTTQTAEEEAAVFAAAEAVASSELEDKAEAVEQPAWVALEEVPVSEALIEDVPRVEEKVIEPDSDQARLDLARELWTAGQEADARVEYEHLLRSNMRGDVTTDLEKLASDESADEPTLRLLGDAYMKQDRLQEALEAYRRALTRL